ncbi:MAG: choice-of-anchor L domain-containing protein, partial [Pseudorhodobacter sp.]
MFGEGVTVTSASYSGAALASGIYSGGLGTSPGVVPSDSGVILSTGRVTDYTNSTGQANQASNTSGNLGRLG